MQNKAQRPGAPARILLVGRDYFFYTKAIAEVLRSHVGAQVDFVTIEPGSKLYNLARRIPGLSQRWLNWHHRRSITQLGAARYDLMVFIQVHQLESRLDWYQARFRGVRCILYYWDSLATHDYTAYLPKFDAVFSFDPDDAAQNLGIQYLPLFFSPDFRSLRDAQTRPYDLSFVGTAVNRTRYEQLAALREQAVVSGIVLHDYLLVSPFFFLSELFRGRWLKRVHFRSLSPARVFDFYSRSAAVLDLPNNRQTGFTMRTFETLGAHRKLVTTNHRAALTDFYTQESIYLLDAGGMLPPRNWLRTGARPANSIENYSLEAWADHLLGLSSHADPIHEASE